MRKFGTASDTPSTSLDLNSLEVNPRFTGEQAPEGDELEDKGQEGLVPEGTEPEGNEPENVGQEGTESEGNEPEKDNKQPEFEATPIEVTDELIFKNLSEKLGREITSFEDLTVQQAPEELDPQIKAIDDWRKKTGRPIEDFFKFQKDYTKVNDLDVAREFLRLEYPTFNDSEIELELDNYKPSEEDLENEAAKRSLELKKYATKGRKALEGLKAELGEPSTGSYTPDVKKKLEFAEQVQSQIESSKGQQKEYSEGITKAALSTEGMKLALSDDLSIDFKISEQDKKGIPSLIEEMPHWRTADGKWNHNAVVQDAIKIKHFDAMIKLAYEQGLNSGKEDLLKKAKNSTLGNNPTGAEQGQESKKPIIEGLDRILGGQKLTMKFGRK